MRRSPHGPRPESGATLIEVLVATVIMGIAFVVIVGGIGTAIIGADLQEHRAGADVALRTAAEDISYVPCADPASYQAGLPALTGFSVTIIAVSHWDQPSNAFGPPPTSCTTGTDTGLQLVELRAEGTTGRGAPAETLQVVKRAT